MRFLTLLCCLLISSSVMAKESKVATVDLQKLFQAYPGAQKAEKKFAAMAKMKEKELEGTAQSLQALQKELKEKGSKMPADEKKKKENDFQKRAKAFQKSKNDIQKELGSKQREMSMKFSGEIKALIAKVAKSAGVELVFDSEKAVYMTEGVDLTDEVLNLYPKSEAKDSDSDNK